MNLKKVSPVSVFSETPLSIQPLPSKRFRTNFEYLDGSLRVFFNGLSEKYITIHSNREFSFGIDILNTDDIEVGYLK